MKSEGDKADRWRAQRSQRAELSWRDSLQHAMDGMLCGKTRNGLARPRPTVLAVSGTGARFEMELRFLAGEEYCCAEAQCFLWTYDRGWWDAVRELLQEVSSRQPPPMVVVIHGVVELGAKLRWLSDGTVGVPSAAYVYECDPRREEDAERRPS